MFGTQVILTDDDLLKIYEFIISYNCKEIEDVMKKFDYVVDMIHLQREFKEKVNTLNNNYYKEIEKKNEKGE
jgi:hypothetical protein